MIVGLTGGIGSGKSTVAQFFRECGITVIDADKISHQLLASDPAIEKKIAQRFGNSILQANGSLDRIQLRERVFRSKPDRLWLEALLHPIIKSEIIKLAAAAKTPYLIVEIPLLIEAQFQDAVQRVLVVDCPEELQIQRVAKRDATPVDIIKAIIQNQASRNERLQHAHDVLVNEEDLETLRKKVQLLHHYYIELSK